MVQQEYGQTLFAPRGVLEHRWLLIVLAVLLVVVLFFVVNAIGSCKSSGVQQAKWGFSSEQEAKYSLNPKDLTSVAAASSITPISLGSKDAGFTVDESQLKELKGAVDTVEKTGFCGFLFVDLSSGRGLAYNTGEAHACFDAAMAPLVVYAATHPYDNSGQLTDTERSEIEEAIVWSSSNNYLNLCATYFDSDYLSWLSELGVAYNMEDSFYPSMSVASLSGVWGTIYDYVRGSSADQAWMSGLFGKTETSFIRNAVEGSGAGVRDKAGWSGGSEISGIVDAGIVSSGGRDYLLVYITGLRDSDEGRERATQLADALFNMRSALAPSMVITYQ